MNEVKYPDVVVQLIGKDGNPFVILARVRLALLQGGVSASEVQIFMNEAMNANGYYQMLQVIMAWVSVELPDEGDLI